MKARKDEPPLVDTGAKGAAYMPVINVLSPHVADMIAAGEVVERPASVIKELMENSFDAGAHNVTVEIRGGGATYIRVTDDGCGMAPEDAGVAFLRHATSKLHDERGLEAISTMGFRGEALAAISAVSRIELTTRLRGSAEGTRVTLEAGDIQDMLPCGCPEGTTMTVRDIFFNTPARLKFLKSDRSEASACVSTALRCALGHPEVSVRFVKDGSEEFFSPGDGRLDSCVYTLLGRELASTLLSVKSEADGMRVTGFTSSPSAGRGNRSAQYFFCNGRYIRSALLQAAVEQAYKNTLLTGRYPACVLYLDMGFGSVDVNVHPAKTEVKFSYEKKVFDLVYHAVQLALEAEDRTAAIELSASTKRAAGLTGAPAKPVSAPAAAEPPHASPRPAPAIPVQGGYTNAAPRMTAQSAPRDDFYRRMSAQEYRGFASGGQKAPHEAAMKNASVPYQTRMEMRPAAPAVPERAELTPTRAENAGISTAESAASNKNVENSVQNVESRPAPDHKILGEGLKTYIIAEMDGQLIFIDKHAAHERMIFDRLKQQKNGVMSQQLLVPVTLRLDGEDAELIEKNGELLTELGFEIEPFGASEYVLRALPADMEPGDAAAAVEEICEKLRRGKTLDPEGARDEILHTVACKAAIKAGWDTDEKELARIADAVLSGVVKYCPHGRPVSAVITKKELDKMFKRIV